MIDDDHAVAALLATFLDRMGLEVTVAHGSQEGASRLAQGGWALVITDLQLSGEGRSEGLSMLDEARRCCPTARTILISGSGGPNIAATARSHGADHFLGKPISFATLSAVVSTTLGLT